MILNTQLNMFSHHTIKLTMMFVMAVVLVNLANYTFYMYYNPNTEALSVARRPIETKKLVFVSSSIIASEPNKPARDHHGIGPGQSSDDKVDNDKLCPALPPGLGRVSVNISMFSFPKEDFDSVVIEGINKMKSCVPRERAAVIVPIAENMSEPFEFVNYLHTFLRKQMLEYQVCLVKQSAVTPYHRGQLINAAFTELLKLKGTRFDCVIIHDPAIIPVDTRNLYRCSWYPRQLVATLNKDFIHTSDKPTFGGVIALTHGQFMNANGFSNIVKNKDVFLDMAKRLSAVNYVIDRTPPIIGDYISLKSAEESIEPLPDLAQYSSHSSLNEGLTTLAYVVEEYEPRNTFLHMQINLPDMQRSTILPAQSSRRQSSSAVDDNIDVNVV